MFVSAVHGGIPPPNQGRIEGGAPGALAPGATVRGRKIGDLKTIRSVL